MTGAPATSSLRAPPTVMCSMRCKAYRPLPSNAIDVGPQRLAALKGLYEAWSADVDADCRKLGIEPKMNDLSRNGRSEAARKVKNQAGPKKKP